MTIDVNAWLAEQRREQRSAVGAFRAAILSGDEDAIRATGISAMQTGSFQPALRAASRLGDVPPAARSAVLRWWVECGDDIREEARDDATLCDALRALLPPYEGAPVQLYRGESAFSRRRRRYGLSWTAMRDVATSFARGSTRTYAGGSVVLETIAAPDAILCSPAMLGDDFAEAEYLIDRRRLGRVTVVERFAQLTHAELAEDLGAEKGGLDDAR